MTDFTKPELRTIYTLLGAVRDRAVPELQEKIRLMLAERAGEQDLGEKVYELRVPLNVEAVLTKGKRAGQTVKRALAPTLNVYGSMRVWARADLYKQLDVRIAAELHRWPRALLRGAVRKRAVRVTRFSSSPPDEITVDVVGGKVPVDRLVLAGVLAGDTAALLLREAIWQPASPRHGSLLVEVFDFVVRVPPGDGQPITSPL